ncbi:MAG: hypothetical protein OXJ52_03370 [Oligoflexia bacterium]|nr:hypothetical protein [Oligoflexia bacterium]
MGLVSLWTQQFLEKNKLSFYFKEQAGNSNDWAKETAFKGLSSPTIFLVNRQSQGRGYGNKKWENSDLMISFLWEKNFSDIHLKASEDFALDLKQALKSTWPQLDFKVKAPNDLYLEGDKLAGLLLEVLKQGSKTALIVGLGLNVFSAPKNLKAVCLSQKTQDIHLKTWQSFLRDLTFYWSQRVKNM